MQVSHKCQDKTFYFDLTDVFELTETRQEPNCSSHVQMLTQHLQSLYCTKAWIAFILVRLSQIEEITHANRDVILLIFTRVVLISGMFGPKFSVMTGTGQREFATYLAYLHLIALQANSVI